jgi:hypothetical protein
MNFSETMIFGVNNETTKSLAVLRWRKLEILYKLAWWHSHMRGYFPHFLKVFQIQKWFLKSID